MKGLSSGISCWSSYIDLMMLNTGSKKIFLNRKSALASSLGRILCDRRQGMPQLSMFGVTTKRLRDKALQETMLAIRAKHGKNSLLKGMNYNPAAKGRERNAQIGGRRA